MSQVVIVAKVKIKEESYLEVYEELLKVYKYTHANDEGCIRYDLHNDADDKYSFVFVETWENQEALDSHMQTEHFLEFVRKSAEKLEVLEVKRLIKINI